jgi:hypothetical protein
MKISRSIRFVALSFAVVVFAALSMAPSQCQAQRRRFVLGQEIGRYLGAGTGAGYHCANPGQSTDYYNPYSDHNSMLISANQPYGDTGQRYPSFGFNNDSIPHSVYTGQDTSQYSTLDSLPGRTVEPTFEPATDRVRRESDDATFEPDLDFQSDREPESRSPAGSSRKSEDPFDVDAIDEDAGGFDALKETFDEIQDDAANRIGDDS